MSGNHTKHLIIHSFLTIFFFFTAISVGSIAADGNSPGDLAQAEDAKPNTDQGVQKGSETQAVTPIEPRAAARVNGVGISQKEFDRSFDNYLKQKGVNIGSLRNPMSYKQMQREVIDALITRELLWQEAEKKEFVVTQEDVERALDQLIENFPSEEAFQARLSQGGYSMADYSAYLKRELSIRELVQNDIAREITVTDGEVHGYYEANSDQFVRPDQVHARHILIKVEPGADDSVREDAKKRIDAILEEARGGADFSELATEHSEGPSGPKGGDLGFITRGQMVKPFDEASFALKPGEISEPVQTIYGYHIIKVDERRGGDKMREEEVREQLRNFLLSGKIQKAVQDRVNTLREESDVKIFLSL